jgi:Ca2+-binding EF-hand superfamily protein
MLTKTKFQSRLFAIVAGAVMFAAAGAASAQTLDRLAEADANGDGNITWQEMLDARSSMFARLDRNGDGFVDSKDSPRMGPMKARFQEALAGLQGADANSDGRVSRSEMLDAPAPLFAEGDTNGDKVLDSEELAALRASAEQKSAQK